MRPETIKTIFTNLIFVIGVILLVFGFSRGALAVGRIIAFEKYPLPSHQEGRCEAQFRPAAAPLAEGGGTPVEETEEYRERCLRENEQMREVRRFEDLINSISLLLAGGVLTYFFRGFIFEKK